MLLSKGTQNNNWKYWKIAYSMKKYITAVEWEVWAVFFNRRSGKHFCCTVCTLYHVRFTHFGSVLCSHEYFSYPLYTKMVCIDSITNCTSNLNRNCTIELLTKKKKAVVPRVPFRTSDRWEKSTDMCLAQCLLFSIHHQFKNKRIFFKLWNIWKQHLEKT